MKAANINLLKEQLPDYLPGVSLDCVILGYQNQNLSLLTMQWDQGNYFSLPGGFIRRDEDLSMAAYRVLEERTGLKVPMLTQFETFGEINRNDRSFTNHILKRFNITDPKIKDWFEQRFISVGFIALVDKEQCTPGSDMFGNTSSWIPIDQLPPLILDHQEMVTSARSFLKKQLNYFPVGSALLDEKFTMKDLQILYETILEKPLDRANFQKRMLKLDILIRHEKKMDGGAYRAPYLYSFNPIRYRELLDRGIGY